MCIERVINVEIFYDMHIKTEDFFNMYSNNNKIIIILKDIDWKFLKFHQF